MEQLGDLLVFRIGPSQPEHSAQFNRGVLIAIQTGLQVKAARTGGKLEAPDQKLADRLEKAQDNHRTIISFVKNEAVIAAEAIAINAAHERRELARLDLDNHQEEVFTGAARSSLKALPQIEGFARPVAFMLPPSSRFVDSAE